MIKFEKTVYSIPNGYVNHDHYYCEAENEATSATLIKSYFQSKYNLKVEVRSIRKALNQNREQYTSIITEQDIPKK